MTLYCKIENINVVFLCRDEPELKALVRHAKNPPYEKLPAKGMKARVRAGVELDFVDAWLALRQPAQSWEEMYFI